MWNLAISGRHYAQLQRHLYPGDGLESAALALCGRSQLGHTPCLLVRELYPVPHAACKVRETNRVTWSPAAMAYVLERARTTGQAVVKFHSHPSGETQFSEADHVSDLLLFGSVWDLLDENRVCGSVVMLPDGRLFGRTSEETGEMSALRRIRVAGNEIRLWDYGPRDATVTASGKRIEQAFGKETFLTMRGLTFGVGGCSGTGSVMIEQLARNAAGHIVGVDPKHMREENLNRIVNSTFADAQAKRAKTEIAGRAIELMQLGVKFTPVPKDILSREAVIALAGCDILVGCTDSVDGRHFLSKIAARYLIPYFDLGVRLDADGKGGIDSACGAVHYIQPGGSSLLSRGVYSQQQLNEALMKKHSPGVYEQRRAEGYIRGASVDRPAVISMNMRIASEAMNEILARLHPFRVEPNSSFAWHFVSVSDPASTCHFPESQPCPIFEREMALGDEEPLLGLVDLSRPRSERLAG